MLCESLVVSLPECRKRLATDVRLGMLLHEPSLQGQSDTSGVLYIMWLTSIRTDEEQRKNI